MQERNEVRKLLSSGDIKGARNLLEKYINQSNATPYDPAIQPNYIGLCEAHELLGLCYVNDTSMAETEAEAEKEAETHFTLAITYSQSTASPYNNLGLLKISQAKRMATTYANYQACCTLFETGLTCLRRGTAVLLDGENIPMFLHSLAIWYEEYAQKLQEYIDNTDISIDESQITVKFEAALINYQKALEKCKEEDAVLKDAITSNYTECLAQYGHYWYKKADYDSATQYYAKAHELNPQHVTVIYQTGMCFSKKENFNQAEVLFRKILTISNIEPQDISDAWLNIAYCSRKQHLYTEAQEALEKAKVQDVRDDEAIANEETELTAQIAQKRKQSRSPTTSTFWVDYADDTIDELHAAVSTEAPGVRHF